MLEYSVFDACCWFGGIEHSLQILHSKMSSVEPLLCFLLQVDAALDASNLEMVTKYVRRCTRPDHEQTVQGIVISLKDKFYECADSLVGVSKTMEKDGSLVYTFDLRGFPEPEFVAAC